MTRMRLVVVAFAAISMLGRFASDAAAQNPFVIDGNVPANGTISGPLQTADPFGSVRCRFVIGYDNRLRRTDEGGVGEVVVSLREDVPSPDDPVLKQR